MSRASGKGGLNYSATLNIEELKKKSEEALKLFKRLQEESAKVIKVNVSSQAPDTKPMSAFQQGVLKLKDELNEKNKVWKDLIITEQKSKALSAESKAETDRLKIAEQELTNQLKAKKITQEEHNLAQRKNIDAQKLAINTQKEADRQANQANKLLKDQLALERQQEAQREKNRKQLQRESSEYYQLNKALNAVRGRTKDVLAAMFDLERQGKKNTAEYKALEQRSKGMVTQTNILDQGIKKIDATLGLHQRQVGNYGLALEGLSPQFAAINAQLAIFGTSIQELSQAGGMAEFGASIVSVGKTILEFLISPVGIVLTALTGLFALFQANKGTVIDFDDKLLSVSKTTNMAGRELAAFGNDVINLSRNLKIVSTDKLLEYSTIAGQLGVKGTKDLLAFSEAMAKLETASDISGEDGGSEIARLLSLTDGGVQNIKAFGDEIVNLGNNFAATEKEILANAENIAQNTGVYRIARQEVLAYATATKATGLEAEAVGSSFSRTLGTFEKAIRTGKNIEVLTKATGKSAEELKAQFKDNASGIFNDFVKGLNSVDKAGGSVNEVLDNIGITAIRDKRVLSTLATNGYDVLSRSLDAVKNSSGAMNQEFETAGGKIKNQTAQFGIAWDNLVLSVENGQGVIGRSSVGVLNAFTQIVDGMTPSTRSFKINEEQVGALAKRYDELKERGRLLGGSFKLTRDEQDELKKVTAELGNLMPSVITQFDKYGNALDINRSKIDQMTKAQRELMAVQNKADIAAANRAFKNAKDAQGGYQDKALQGTSSFLGITMISDATVADYKDKATKLSGIAWEAAKDIRALGGTLTKEQQEVIDYYEKVTDKATETIKATTLVSKGVEDGSTRTTDVIKAEIKALEEDNKKLGVQSRELKVNVGKIKTLKKELKLANGGTDTEGNREVNQYQLALKSQRAMQSEIDAFTKKGRNKQLDADTQELADVDAKYEKLFEKAKKFNDSVASYNKDPKNKNKKIGVNTSGLLNAQSTESDVVRDKQATAKLKITLDEQKKLYDEYENYKGKLGVDQANKLASGKIDAEKTYLKYLESEESRLLGVDDKGKGSDGGGVRNDQQLKLVREEIKITKEAKEKADKEMYADAYLAAETFAQKELAIRKRYNEQLDALLKKQNGKITDEQRKNLDGAKDSAINAAKDEALAKTAIYKKLAEETLIMTREQVKEQVKALKGVMDAGGISEADKQKIKDRIGDLEITLKIGVDQVNLDNLKAEYQDTLTELNSVDQDGNSIISEESKKRIIKRLEEIQAKIDGIDSNGDGVASWGDKVAENFKYLKGDTKAVAEGVSKDLGQLSSGFNELSNAFGGADTQAGYLMGTIGDLAKVGADAAGAVAGFASGDIVGGITKTISAVAGIFSMGKKVKEMNLKARKEVSDFYAAAVKGETEYQVLLRKRELDTVARGKNSYKAIVDQLEAIKKQSPEIQKAYDNIFNSLQGQEAVEGKGYKHGTLFRKAKTWDIMASLAGSDYKRLEQLYTQGKLKDAAKADFEALKALKDELEAAGISAEDLQKQLGELLTGTSTSGLADGLKALFENGKTSAQDFGDSFEQIMKNSIMNTFKAKYLDDALQPFYNELAAMMGGSTPTEDQIAALKAKYVQIGKEADVYLDNIQKITGQDLSDKGNQSALKSNNTLTAALNQPTAERLEGLWRGNFELTKQLVTQGQVAGLTMGEMLQVGRSKLAALEKIAANTLRSADNTDRLAVMETTLTAIEKNTKPTKTTRD